MSVDLVRRLHIDLQRVVAQRCRPHEICCENRRP